MQSATGQTKRPGNTGAARRVRRPVRKGLLPITIGIAAFIALASIGIMTFVLLGFWPPKVTEEVKPTLDPTPVAIRQAGLTIEKAGPIESDPSKPGQFLVPVKVTNNVKRSARLLITPTPGVQAPTPTASAATVLNADIRVIFYQRNVTPRKIVGVAYGNATNIPYGQSKTVQVVGIGISNPQDLDYDVLIDSMWTDKDALLLRSKAAFVPIQSATLPRTP